MTVDLTYLVWTVALTMVQLLVVIIGAMATIPTGILAGNRETPVEAKGWLGRAQRAHRNMLESVALFGILVLVAHVAGKANAMTAMGAAIYFWARLVYTDDLHRRHHLGPKPGLRRLDGRARDHPAAAAVAALAAAGPTA